jgi:hypothetical protein
MAIHKGPPLDIKKEIYTYHPPLRPEEHGGATEIGSFHGSDIKFDRDFKKCKDCGGTGTKWVKRRRSSRLTECGCKYTVRLK